MRIFLQLVHMKTLGNKLFGTIKSMKSGAKSGKREGMETAVARVTPLSLVPTCTYVKFGMPSRPTALHILNRAYLHCTCHLGSRGAS
jgi:hypothetical protein